MQLGAKVRRGAKRKEFFHLGDQLLYRNHYGYIPVSSFPPKATLLSSYKGEVMTARYKHCLMTQWHPERTADGYLFLIRWLNES